MTIGTFRSVMGGGVKSVQRGVYASSSTAETRVAIAAVNTNKTMVSVNSRGYGNVPSGTCRLLDATGLGVTSFMGFDSSKVYWEVVEFY